MSPTHQNARLRVYLLMLIVLTGCEIEDEDRPPDGSSSQTTQDDGTLDERGLYPCFDACSEYVSCWRGCTQNGKATTCLKSGLACARSSHPE